MPITLAAFDDSPLCVGQTWLVNDRPRLAACVAALVIGDHLQAATILQKLKRGNPAAHRAHLDRQIKALVVEPGATDARWQRDGWVFQMISWVAATLAGPPSMIIRAPQPRKSDKGPDGVMVMPPNAVERGRVVICEDKATINPRRVIRDEVWPELESFEARERDNEILSDVQALMSFVPDVEVRRALVKTLWSEAFHYRVCVTVAMEHEGRLGREALFDGYDGCVTGTNCARRRAETFSVPGLRDWMDDFCEMVVVELEGLREQSGV